MKYLTLATSIAIAAVAAYFSIIGLATLFAGAFWSVVVMASILEVGKLVSTAWLHYEWEKVNVLTRTYFISAILILMFITSMGIFGYLSKAHLDQKIQAGGNNNVEIRLLQNKIESEQRNIRSGETVLASLDQAVQVLIDYDRIRGPEGALAVRESQKEERAQVDQNIQASQQRIDELNTELIPLQRERFALEAEIGPLKYVAELIYGQDNASDHYDTAVRFIILIIVLVFDPLAVMLLVVSTGAFKRDHQTPDKPLINENQIMVMR
jgi:cell division protein FtsB